MKHRVILTSLIVVLGWFQISPATYKSLKIDGRHFPAVLVQSGSDVEYKADVVFKGKAVNINFLIGQVLPATTRNNRLLTLYLYEEKITDPDRIHLKQVIPPVQKRRGNDDPDTWEVVAEWWMSVDLDD